MKKTAFALMGLVVIIMAALGYMFYILYNFTREVTKMEKELDERDLAHIVNQNQNGHATDTEISQRTEGQGQQTTEES